LLEPGMPPADTRRREPTKKRYNKTIYSPTVFAAF